MKHARIGLVVLAVAVPFTTTAAAISGGGLDPTFDGDGIVVTSVGGQGLARDVLVQPDGKVVIVGQVDLDPTVTRMEFAVARYNVDGTLDPSFDGDGLVSTGFGSRVAVGNAGALQPDGRLLVAGFRGVSPIEEDFVLVRYTAEGALDPSFGRGGVVTTDFGGTRDEAVAVLVQGDGKIVVAGHRFSGPTGNGPSDFALARYDAVGNLDASFGNGGYVVTDMGDFDLVTDAALQSDGKIVVAGSTGTGFPGQTPTKIALARYTSEGALDPTFDGDGRAVTDVATPEAAEAIAVQADGKILVSSGPQARFAVVRYRSDGKLDTSFGNKGFAAAQLPGTIPVDVAVQGNGKIVAVGAARDTSGDRNGYALARFLPDGKVDATFGSSGVATAAVGAGAWPMALAITPDGKLVAAGSVGANPGLTMNFAVTRFLPGTCSVPNMRGKTLAGARTRLAAGNCRLGTVRRVVSKRVKKGRVVSQSPAPGSEAADWALVNLVLSRGRK